MSDAPKPIKGLPEHPFTDTDVQRAAQVTQLAGGPTFEPEYTEDDADVIVSEVSEWDRADQNDVVYIADGVRLDVTGREPFNLDNTVVCGGRHKRGVEPGMVVDNEGGPGSVSYSAIFQARNSPGHVHGIRIRGSSWYPERAGIYEREAPSDARCWPGYTHIPKTGTTRSERDKMRSEAFGRGVMLWTSGSTVRNCDIHGFTHAGVSIGARTRAPTNVEITHSMLHNCAIPGLGYPINIYNGRVLSEHNYFNAYRHSITGFGHPTCSYTTKNDVHGPDALLSPIDMHNLNENGTPGDLTAGGYVRIENTTVLASHRFETPDWYSKSEQPAVGIRGYPEDNIYITDSQFMQKSSERAFNHINVSNPRQGWVVSGNEYGYDNWSPDNGVGIDFHNVEKPVPPTPSRAEAVRARARALGERLGRLRNHV